MTENVRQEPARSDPYAITVMPTKDMLEDFLRDEPATIGIATAARRHRRQVAGGGVQDRSGPPTAFARYSTPAMPTSSLGF